MGSGARGSDDPPGPRLPPPPNNDKPKPKKEKKVKPPKDEAVDLLMRGTQRTIEADGMHKMLTQGGMHLGLYAIDSNLFRNIPNTYVTHNR